MSKNSIIQIFIIFVIILSSAFVYQKFFKLRSYVENTDKKFRVIAYDYGVKKNILRILFSMGCDVEVVPAKTSVKNILSKNFNNLLDRIKNFKAYFY